MLESLRRDLRFSLRQLRKTPGFTITAIVVLALGMCASLAIFAFVDAALIKPLPYRDQARLVGVYETTRVFPRSNLSYGRGRLRTSRFPHSAVSRGVRLPFVGRDLLGELFEPLMTKSEARVCRRMGILVPDRGII